MFEPTVLRGEVITPEVQEGDRRIPITPRTCGSHYPFTLGFCHTWEYVETGPVAEGGEWLPEYREIRHVGGGNGSSEPREGVVNPQAHLNGMLAKGAIIVRNGDPRLGPYAHYLARHETRGGGDRQRWMYCFAPVEWALIANGREAVPTNSPAVQEWVVGLRRQMITGGIVPPMARQQLDTHLNVITQRVRRWTEAADKGRLTQAAYDVRVREANRTMSAMIAAWERQFDAAVRAQVAQAPKVRAQPVTLDEINGPEGLELAPEPEQDTKAITIRLAEALESQVTDAQREEAREAAGIKLEGDLQRYGEAKISEYVSILQGWVG